MLSIFLSFSHWSNKKTSNYGSAEKNNCGWSVATSLDFREYLSVNTYSIHSHLASCSWRFFSTPVYVRSWPRVRSRWLDLGRVLFLRFYGSRQVEIHKKEKMNEANIQSSWPNKLGQWRIYFMVKRSSLYLEAILVWRER